MLQMLQDGAREGRFNAKAAASAALDSDSDLEKCGPCTTSNNCVTAISFDKNQRRLVLCTNSGAVTVWNFNNGSLLRRCAAAVMTVLDSRLCNLVVMQCLYVWRAVPR
jgi:WD40 repeat protein